MKKTFKLILAALLCAAMVFGLSSCGIIFDWGVKECEHEFSEWTQYKAPTCTDDGESRRTCAKCGEVESEAISALGHDMTAVSAKAPTCTEGGWEAYEQCSRCEYNTKVALDCLDHAWSEDWTSGETSHWHACTHEGCEAKKDEAEHAWEWKNDESKHWQECTEDGCGAKKDEAEHADGDHDHSCDDCSYKMSEHNYGEATYAWNGDFSVCTAHRVCAYCNHVLDVNSESVAYENYVLTAKFPADSGIPDDTIDLSDATDMSSAEIKIAIAYMIGHATGDTADVKLTLASDASDETFEAIRTALDSDVIPNGSINLAINGAERIPTEAFKDCYKLRSVTLGESVSKIERLAFSGCKNISVIAFPSNLKYIGHAAFMGCDALVSATIPDSVTTLGDSAFYGCDKLESVYIGDGVTKIDDSTFTLCKVLAEVKIGKNVTSIGSSAFSQCEALKSITLPSSVKIIEVLAFTNCFALENITIEGAIDEMGDYVFQNCSKLKSITFCDAIASVNEKTFKNYKTENATLILPYGQRVLTDGDGDGTLTATDSLVAAGDTSFGGYTFKNIIVSDIDATDMSASELKTEITGFLTAGMKSFGIKLAADASNDMFEAIRAAFNSSDIADGSLMLTVSGATTIPDNFIGYYTVGQRPDRVTYSAADKFYSISLPDATSVGSRAFMYCEKLESVYAPCLTSVGQGAFSVCSGLKTIDLSLVTYVGNSAFNSCDALTSVDLPVATFVGECAFSDCKGLKSISFGALTEIPKMMLQNSTALTEISFGSAVTSGSEDWLNNVSPSSRVVLTVASGQEAGLDMSKKWFFGWGFKEIIISSEE